VVPGGRGPRRLAAYFVLTGTASLLQPGHIQVTRDLLLDLLSDDDVDRLTETMTRVRDLIRAEPPRPGAGDYGALTDPFPKSVPPRPAKGRAGSGGVGSSGVRAW
jgi:hypothetical protein